MTVANLRSARPLDAGTIGAILVAANGRLSWMPQLYTGAQAIGFAGDMIEAGWVRLAECDGAPCGFLARNGAEVHGLYLWPAVQGRGIARALMQDAQWHCESLGLWSFAANDRASRFYRKAGFCEVARSDGTANDARLPDIRFEWHRESV